MSQFAKAWAGDRARGCVIGLIATVIALPLLCLFFISVPFLVSALESLDPSLVPWVLVGATVVCTGLMLALAFGAIALSVWRRGSWLDGVFAPLGLKGSLYMLRGRQYRGTVHPLAGTGERDVDIRFYQGPTLDMYITTSVMTRYSVAEKAAVIPGLAQAFGREPLALDDPALSDLSVLALDADWTRWLLAQPEAQAALARLMKASNWAMFRQVHLQPGMLLFKLYRNRGMFRYDISPEEGRQWLEDLMTLARVAESLPAPQVTAEVSSAEQMVRSGGLGKAVLPITVAMIIALVVGIPLCGIAITVAILALAK
jgi:hypothetical protein